MSVYHEKQTGTLGKIEIFDRTDADANTVDLYIEGSGLSTRQLPWSYSIDGVDSELRSFQYHNVVGRQYVYSVHVGYALTFKFRLENTGTVQLGGPTELEINLQRGLGFRVVSIKVGNEYKQAVPLVRVGGIWKPASAMIMVNSEWKAVT